MIKLISKIIYCHLVFALPTPSISAQTNNKVITKPQIAVIAHQTLDDDTNPNSNSIYVDAYIEENLTIKVQNFNMGNQKNEIYTINPQGHEIPLKPTPSGVEITVTNPTVGNWTIHNTNGGKLTVTGYGTQEVLLFADALIHPDLPGAVKIWANVSSTPRIISNITIYATIVDSNGKVFKINLLDGDQEVPGKTQKPDGQYSRILKLASGKYSILITAGGNEGIAISPGDPPKNVETTPKKKKVRMKPFKRIQMLTLDIP